VKTPSLVVAIALAAAFACTGDMAAAAPPRPADLRVAGDDGWRASNSFSLTWTIPPLGEPIAATHYRIRNPQGTAIGEGGLGWMGDGIGGLVVPSPGAYSAEVWFEDFSGAHGPAATTQLRFDDERPAPAQPGAVAAWIGRTAFPLRIPCDPPPGPQPISGIRGYAVVAGAAPFASPCAAPDRCLESETTVRGADGQARIDTLPDGTNYLHAVTVSGSGMRSATSVRTTLRVDTTDPLTRLHGAPPGWTNQAVELVAHAVDSGSGMGLGEGGPRPFTAIRVDGNPAAIGWGGSVAASVIEEGVHRIAFYARDAAGNVDDGGNGNKWRGC
jgi:hypothetical protein